MQVGVVYATKTGHSRKIARAVARELAVEARDIRDCPDLEGLDCLFVVGGIYGGKSLPELAAFAGSIRGHRVRQAVLLTSSASRVASQTEIRQILEENGVDVLPEEFRCRGSFLVLGLGHPNAADLEAAVTFARGVLDRG